MEHLIISDSAFGGRSMEEIGDVCEGTLATDSGDSDFSFVGSHPGALHSRKEVCRFLGIGESTLTGWMQAKRIPRTAAIALVLYWNLEERIKRLNRLEQEQSDPKVIAMDGKYAVCEFYDEREGECDGKIIAQSVPDVGTARAISRFRSAAFLQLLKRSADRLHEYYEIDPDQLEYVRELTNELDRDHQLATDYPAWVKERRAPPINILKLPLEATPGRPMEESEK